MARECAMCSSKNTAERCEREEWELAFEGLPKMICSIPVTHCIDCGFTYTDERVEKIKDSIHEAFAENWSSKS